MERDTFDRIDPMLDQLADRLEHLLQLAEMETIRDLVGQIGQLLGDHRSATLDIQLQIVDSEKKNSLPLLQMGFATDEGSDPYLCYGDSTPHRYLVDGTVVVVPHDHCPSCWGQWDVKDLHPTCPQCGISMGKQVKWMLDHDRCPNCEQSTVSSQAPKCSLCGYSINPDFIHWG
jgi:ribosomal protein L37E